MLIHLTNNNMKIKAKSSPERGPNNRPVMYMLYKTNRPLNQVNKILRIGLILFTQEI